MYCQNVHCSEFAPCPTHGAESQSNFLGKVKETAHNAAQAIRGVFGGDRSKDEEIPELRTNSVADTIMHMPTAGQDAVKSATVATESDTAHTWEQQHEGGLRHRAKVTAVGAAETVGEKASIAAGVIKDKAVEATETLAETGHNARVKVDDVLERNFGSTAEKIQVGGEKIRKETIEETAGAAEFVKGHLGNAVSSLKDQERTELQKTEDQKLAPYHSTSDRTIDNALERNFGERAHETQVEGQKLKEGAIHETAHAVEIIQDTVGHLAASLREQQREEANLK